MFYCYRVELESVRNVGFCRERETGVPGENFCSKDENRQTQPTYDISHQPGHIGGRRVLSPRRHPFSPNFRNCLSVSLLCYCMISFHCSELWSVTAASIVRALA